MRQLEIAYCLDGKQRGYQFVGSTTGFNDDTLKTVWRNAMPKGQGWGVEIYRGARTLKAFSLADGRFALSEVVVTEQQDESGRTGIRSARVDVMQPGEYAESLVRRLSAYEEWVQAEIQRGTGLFGRSRIPEVNGDEQVVLCHPYDSQRWEWVEALVLNAARQAFVRRWRGGHFVAFTTLALDWRGESALVVLPADRAGGVRAITL
jgi:hypothetical protein